jgi:NlpC/P60 family putative phage cell wall peptidase
MQPSASRKALVEEAKTWVGTPYHHQAGVKGVGVDCAYLVARVGTGAGVLPSPTIPPYTIEWAMHSKSEFMLDLIEKFGGVKADYEWPLPGDILTFQYGRAASHMGIMIDEKQFIHGHVGNGINRVVVNSLDGDFVKRLHAIYKYPGIKD